MSDNECIDNVRYVSEDAGLVFFLAASHGIDVAIGWSALTDEFLRVEHLQIWYVKRCGMALLDVRASPSG